MTLIMSLMYLARFTFGQILVYVNFLSTRLSKPKVQDMKKAKRILRYLAGGKITAYILAATRSTARSGLTRATECMLMAKAKDASLSPWDSDQFLCEAISFE